jgi:hypothetical protein
MQVKNICHGLMQTNADGEAGSGINVTEVDNQKKE